MFDLKPNISTVPGTVHPQTRAFVANLDSVDARFSSERGDRLPKIRLERIPKRMNDSYEKLASIR